ncbi:hypothetical protein CCMA1212_002123, partial [Trichoderma ghanense]
IGSIFGVAGAHADTRLASLATTYTLLNAHPGSRIGGVTWRREVDGYQSAYLSNNVTVAQLSTVLQGDAEERVPTAAAGEITQYRFRRSPWTVLSRWRRQPVMRPSKRPADARFDVGCSFSALEVFANHRPGLRQRVETQMGDWTGGSPSKSRRGKLGSGYRVCPRLSIALSIVTDASGLDLHVLRTGRFIQRGRGDRLMVLAGQLTAHPALVRSLVGRDAAAIPRRRTNVDFPPWVFDAYRDGNWRKVPSRLRTPPREQKP